MSACVRERFHALSTRRECLLTETHTVFLLPSPFSFSLIVLEWTSATEEFHECAAIYRLIDQSIGRSVGRANSGAATHCRLIFERLALYRISTEKVYRVFSRDRGWQPIGEQ